MKKKILESANVPRKKAKFEYARSEDIDALWQQISRQDVDVENSDSKALSVDCTKPSNGLNHANESEQPPRQNKDQLENQTSHLATQKFGACNAYDKLEKIYKRFGKIMLLHLKQHQNKMRIKKLRRRTFDTFKHSEHFDQNIHSDEFLEREFQRALNKRRRFAISDDQRNVSISNVET
ncbi:hypothetical protein TcWFU_005422 [Taenia crassiceps]|uniref:Uncharacterized protein n=1 Tax=Taenia crassiceps TaxID=6207 RepID=A0ABR4QR04_9CEST